MTIEKTKIGFVYYFNCTLSDGLQYTQVTIDGKLNYMAMKIVIDEKYHLEIDEANNSQRSDSIQ